jgi:hypothetical protein
MHTDNGAGEPSPKVTKMLTLTFDSFGWAALNAHAKAEGLSLGDLVSQACAHFHLDLPNRRPAAVVPWFARKRGAECSEMPLALPGEVWKSLADEAHRQRLPLVRLIEHAALYYVADVQSDRAPLPPVPVGTESEATVRRIAPRVRPRDREA